jgi:hypothetical protein
VEQVQLCFAVNLISIILDIVVIAVHFPRYENNCIRVRIFRYNLHVLYAALAPVLRQCTLL